MEKRFSESEVKSIKHEGHEGHKGSLGFPSCYFVSFVVKKVSFMNCLICRQADIVDGLTSVTFERDEFRLVVNNVPARVCTNCAEAFLVEDVAIRLLSEAETVLAQGMMDDVIEYGHAMN
jgi:YgiT-type zinc finger domain-containing protein